MIIKIGTWVQIKKPTLLKKYWKKEWKKVYWSLDMNRYNNKISCVVKLNDISCSLSNNHFDWHYDWLVPLKLDKNNKPIPNDNDGRKSCYWCKRKIKTKIVKYEKGVMKYTYCPNCLR
jgi:hypothetical protein